MGKFILATLAGAAFCGCIVSTAHALDTVEVNKSILFVTIGKKKVGLYAANGTSSRTQVEREAERNAHLICKALNYGNAVHYEYKQSERARLPGTTVLDYRVMNADGKAEVQKFSLEQRLLAMSATENFEFVSIECENIRSASVDTDIETAAEEKGDS